MATRTGMSYGLHINFYSSILLFLDLRFLFSMAVGVLVDVGAEIVISFSRKGSQWLLFPVNIPAYKLVLTIYIIYFSITVYFMVRGNRS